MKSQAAISDHRFERPLCPDDLYAEIPLQSGDIDFAKLKDEAETNAERSAEFVKNHLPIPRKMTPDEKVKARAQRILNLLMLTRYRRGPKEFVDTQNTLARIVDSINSQSPVELILSFFGYKVCNRLKTWAETGTEVDLSETASLLRFYEIAKAIDHLHEGGGQVTVACDGSKYAPAVGFSEEQGKGYFKNVSALAEHMGIDNSVKLVDEADHYPGDHKEKAGENCRRVHEGYINGNQDIVSLVGSLRKSIALTIPIAKSISIETVALAFCEGINDEELKRVSKAAFELRMWIQDQSLASTVKYIGYYNAVKNAGVIERIAPHALRATVHPKPGQIGLYAINKANDNRFPHHGQGVICADAKPGNYLDKVRVRFQADIRRPALDEGLKGICLPQFKYRFATNERHPFVFKPLIQNHD